jgi:hypothetical protein
MILLQDVYLPVIRQEHELRGDTRKYTVMDNYAYLFDLPVSSSNSIIEENVSKEIRFVEFFMTTELFDIKFWIGVLCLSVIANVIVFKGLLEKLLDWDEEDKKDP